MLSLRSHILSDLVDFTPLQIVRGEFSYLLMSVSLLPKRVRSVLFMMLRGIVLSIIIV